MTATRIYADPDVRDETDPCECGTVGCSIDHTAEHERFLREGGDREPGCDTW